MNSLKTVERRPWDSINSLQVAFHDAWSEPGPQDSHSDSIFSHIPPAVSTLNLHLGYKEKIVAINNELHLHIPETVLTNLTTFTFSYDWNGTMMLKLLQSCTNVENLTLDFKGSFMEYEDTPFTQGAFQEGLLLPKVRTLHLDRMLPDIVYFLRALRTPSLVELHLSFYTEITDPVAFTDLAYIPDNFAAHVLSLVQRSGCQGSLRKFRLNSANIPNLQLTTILVNLPSLTHLTLDNTFFDPTPFGDITYVYSKAPQFLPCLEVFELLRLSPDFPHDDIQFFAISRRESREPPRSLKRLTMTFRTHTPPDLFDLVHTFKDAFPMETTFFAFVE
ncbi:hypothetical protein EST38_g446 [Candolleomyces aberdarensis]|uniref:Uncharacterized protein n=1 Tax=Candolleomyces aberdarensis TaxID=2316362 RepID=A0A4Q2DYQ6_9AGAR|nr:hypothetical protein EST38_g446 [Candolleomyces aberdarensis]